MNKHSVVIPSYSDRGICIITNDTTAGDIDINGRLSHGGKVSLKGYAVSVSIYATGDQSANTFTITGSYNNKEVIEVIAGPNNDNAFVTGNMLFDKIFSIQMSANTEAEITIGCSDRVFVLYRNLNAANTRLSTLNEYSIVIADSMHNNVNINPDQNRFEVYGVSRISDIQRFDELLSDPQRVLLNPETTNAVTNFEDIRDGMFWSTKHFFNSIAVLLHSVSTTDLTHSLQNWNQTFIEIAQK